VALRATIAALRVGCDCREAARSPLMRGRGRARRTVRRRATSAHGELFSTLAMLRSYDEAVRMGHLRRSIDLGTVEESCFGSTLVRPRSLWLR
jgi:hypothetical protein